MHVLVTIVTFMVFFIEAMLHYNIGINRGKSLINFCLQMPALRDMVKIIIILAFSYFVVSSNFKKNVLVEKVILISIFLHGFMFCFLSFLLLLFGSIIILLR